MRRAACRVNSNVMLHIVGRTHPGTRGGENQDSIGWDESRQLALVADGMGGYAGGEVARGVVKQALLGSAETLSLEEAVMDAHAKVLAAAAQHPEDAGMGSTVVMVRVADRLAKVVWVGDSRAYLWRHLELRPLTRDHSVVEVLRDAENLSETEIRSHPLRHKVIQSLGLDTPVPSADEIPLSKGDWLLLCSDGLTGELLDAEIADVLRNDGSLESAADALINRVLASAEHDDVSVVIAEYTGPSKFGLHWNLSESAILWLSVMGGFLLAIIVAIVGWWVLQRI